MNDIPTELAHDLRMPLQLILSCAQLLRSELGDAPSPAAAYAELMMDSVRQLEALLEGSLSAPDAPLRTGRFDLAASLRSLCLRCQPAAAERGVGLRYVSNAAALSVVSDEERLTRAVMNLISNALRFTPAGGSVTLRLTALGDRAEIAVADTGRGIEPERLPRVFDPGETTGGHGYGLAICRELAEALGGSLRAESVPGRGSAFTLRLPLNIRSSEAS